MFLPTMSLPILSTMSFADVTTAMSLPTYSLQIMLLPTWDYDYQSWIYSLSSKLMYVHRCQLCHSLLYHCQLCHYQLCHCCMPLPTMNMSLLIISLPSSHCQLYHSQQCHCQLSHCLLCHVMSRQLSHCQLCQWQVWHCQLCHCQLCHCQ